MTQLKIRTFAISAAWLMARSVLPTPGAAQTQCSLMYSGLESPLYPFGTSADRPSNQAKQSPSD
jgi:hypothetical protein